MSTGHLPLLQDYCRQGPGKQQRQQQQLRTTLAGNSGGGGGKAKPTAQSSMASPSRQTAVLILKPSSELTARYYNGTSNGNKGRSQLHHVTVPAAGDQWQDAAAEAASRGYCKRYPFSQVIYPNLTSAASPPALSCLPRPGGLLAPSLHRSPTFVRRHHVRQSRSGLGHALASGNSSEAVVHRAIDQLRESMELPIGGRKL